MWRPKVGLHLIIGATFTLQDSASSPPIKLILLAQNREGYGNLCELISLGRQRAKKGSYRLYCSDISDPDNPNLKNMAGCLAILLPSYNGSPSLLQTQASWLKQHFLNRSWIGLHLPLQSHDAQHKQHLITTAYQLQLPIVATGNVHMHVRSRKPLLDTLIAIQHGTSIAKSAQQRSANAEQHLRTRLRLATLYPPETLQQSLVIAQRCTFSLTQIRYQYPHEICPEHSTPHDYLREQSYIGAHWRYPKGIPLPVQALLEKSSISSANCNTKPIF